MNDRRYSHDHDHALLIDRLATDELDDDSRRMLFAWLDREPARWRRCALALLEAREMEGAFDDWLGEGAANSATPIGRKRPIALPEASESGDRRSLGKRERRPGRYATLAMAASVALAFGLGMAADRRWIAQRAIVAAPEAAAQSSAVANGNSRVGPPSRGEISASDSQQPAASPSSPSGDEDLIPAYVKSQLERHGYRVDSRRQFVSISLPDGRRTLVPVERWKFSYVGNRAL
jgi:hypothetical protein